MEGDKDKLLSATAFFWEYEEWDDRLGCEESLVDLYTSTLGSFAPMRAEIAGLLPCWRPKPAAAPTPGET